MGVASQDKPQMVYDPPQSQLQDSPESDAVTVTTVIIKLQHLWENRRSRI